MKKFYAIVASVMMSAFSFVANAQNELVVGDVKVGDLITLSDGSQWYVGSNEVTNGSFETNPAENDNNIVGWTVGGYKQMTTSNFLWFPEGGYDGGAYIQASKHTGANGDGSVCQRWAIEPNTRYYFSFYLAHNSADNQYIPVITLTSVDSEGGGQNEKLSEGAKQLIGKNGEDSGEILGYGNFLDEDGDGYGEWCQTACSFTSEEYTWLQFNARWLKENKIQACFDGVFLAKLYNPEDMTPEQVAFMALQAEISSAYEFAENQLADYESLAAELGDYIQESGLEDLTEEASLEELQNAIDALHKKVESYKAVLPMLASFEATYDEATAILESGVCPDGTDALSEVLSTLGDWQDNGYPNESADKTAEEYIIAQTEILRKAISDYFATATAGTDLTYFIDNPTFETQGDWYKGSYTGGDQRINTSPNGSALPEGIGSCWNAWSNQLNINNSVSISQDLTGLPNGYYSVSAQMITQSGLITNQHLFIQSSTNTAVSPVLTSDTWEAAEWETLTTEKVLVTDGKLTIGAIGSGDNEENSTRGWFCVTDFKLTFQGAATDEEMAAAVAAAFAEAEARTVSFAADNATYKAAVAEAKAASDLDALKAAIAEADKSDAEYKGVIEGSYKQLQDSIETAYNANAKALAKVVVDHMTNYLASAEATYKDTPAKTEIQRIFLNELIPALQKAEKAAEEATSADAKAFINTAITNYISALSTYTADKEYLYAQKAELEEVLQAATLTDVKVGDGADLTAYIVNPTVDDNSASGWTVKRYIGNTNAASGQQYDGQAGCYLDTWNGTPGATRCTWYQVLNVPNGKYKLSNIMRTSGEGAYLFASDKDVIVVASSEQTDTTALDPTSTIVLSEAQIVATPNAKYGITAEEETTAHTDAYGELWMAAADRIIAALNIKPAEGSTIYDLAVDANDGSEDCPANVDPTDWNIIKANSGKGRGWFNNSLEIEVKNHVLTIGMTCDPLFIKADDTCTAEVKAWTGTWLSGDNFQLTLVKEGDNTGWNPLTAIDTVAKATDQPSAIYTLSGVKTNTMTKGINIVKMANGTVVKVVK